MKKPLIFAILALLALGVYLHAQRQSRPPSPYRYDGPKDQTPWTEVSDVDHGISLFWTTLGPLARCSDIIGVGQVSQRGEDHFTVTIDHALVGCTNGAAIVVYYNPEVVFFDLPPSSAYFPTNQGRIVFAARTNEYSFGHGDMFWNHAEIPEEPEYIHENLSLRFLNRSWWYADRDDGVLFTQFTNVLQAVRFDRNWTNYFYLCRDGANSASDRVREDSFKDLRSISIRTTDEQAQFIVDDPLVDQKHKDLILYPGWRVHNRK